MAVEVSPYQIESAARRLSPAQRKQVLLEVFTSAEAFLRATDES